MAAKVSLPSINEMFPEHMLGPLYTDRDRSPSTQAHEPQQALRPHDPGYAPHPSVSPDSAYDATPAPAPPRSRPSFRVQIPPPPPYEPSSSSYTPSSSYAPSSSTSAYPPSSAYTPSSSTSTLPSYAPSPATFRAVPLPSPYTLPTADAFAPSFVPPQFAPQQPYASPAQLGPQPYVSAAHFGGAGGPMVSVASEEKKHCCPHCLKRFNRPSSLSIHVNTHTGAKPFKCPFPGCSRAFNVNSNMRRHWRNHLSAARRAGGGGGGVGPGAPFGMSPVAVPDAPPAHEQAPSAFRHDAEFPPAPLRAQAPAGFPPAAAGPRVTGYVVTPPSYAPQAHAAAELPETRPRYTHGDAHASRSYVRDYHRDGEYSARLPLPHTPPREAREERAPPTPPLSHSASSSPQSSSGHSLPPVGVPPQSAYAPAYYTGASKTSYVAYAAFEPTRTLPGAEAHRRADELPSPGSSRERGYDRRVYDDDGSARDDDAGDEDDDDDEAYSEEQDADALADMNDNDENDDEDEDDAYPPPPLSPQAHLAPPPAPLHGRTRSRSSPRLAPGRYAPYAAPRGAQYDERTEWARPEGRARSSTVAGEAAPLRAGRWWD